jgi:uncharacterized membrane protein
MEAKNDTLYVAAATYDDVNDAKRDFDAIGKLYDTVGTSNDFDAAVIERDDKGRVRIVKTREQPSRHGAAVGLAWGLAAGIVAALFPAIGIWTALTAGGAAGATIGALAGHAAAGMSRHDLKQVGEQLDRGRTGLLVVYAANRADQIAQVLKTGNVVRVGLQNARIDELTKAVNEAKTFTIPKAPAKV